MQDLQAQLVEVEEALEQADDYADLDVRARRERELTAALEQAKAAAMGNGAH